MTGTSALHRKYTTWVAERGYQPIREWNDAADREDAGEDEDDA
jgi:hypothetical protein